MLTKRFGSYLLVLLIILAVALRFIGISSRCSEMDSDPLSGCSGIKFEATFPQKTGVYSL